MNKYIFILLAFLFLSSCEDSQVSNGRKLWKAYLNTFAKDPSSIVIYNESYTKDGMIEWTIDYGGKNSYGGMTRSTLKCRTASKYLFVDDEVFTKEELGL